MENRTCSQSMLKLVSFHIQAHLNAFLQILEYFSQICLGPLARESPCTTDHKEGEQLEDRRNVGESSCNFGDEADQRVQSLMFMMMRVFTFNCFMKRITENKVLMPAAKHGSSREILFKNSPCLREEY